MNYYEIVGVSKNASADEIRRVFRKKAETLHPDKASGNHNDMALLNHAYEVLIDPVTREVYDRTGQDKETPLEVEVRNVLLQSFTQALMKEAPDALKFTRQMLEQGRRESEAMQVKIETKRSQWSKRRNKITRKKGENAFHMIIDQQLKALEGEAEKATMQLKIIDAAIEELKQYKSSEKVEVAVYGSSWSSAATRATY